LRLGDADQRQAVVGFGDDAVLIGEGWEPAATSIASICWRANWSGVGIWPRF
jgi:hypothetical protein